MTKIHTGGYSGRRTDKLTGRQADDGELESRNTGRQAGRADMQLVSQTVRQAARHQQAGRQAGRQADGC